MYIYLALLMNQVDRHLYPQIGKLCEKFDLSFHDLRL
jgi:hypothetical protein